MTDCSNHFYHDWLWGNGTTEIVVKRGPKRQVKCANGQLI